MSCGVGHRRSLDLALLWLQLWPAAVDPILPLTWEPPYAGVALETSKKRQKIKNKKKVKNKKTCTHAQLNHFAVKQK